MQNEDLSRLATLYYVDGLTQEDLSQMFSISRATVGRMLRRALQEGIVEIRVRPSNTLSSDLEKALIERFGIKRALISVDHKDQDKQRALLAGLVASHLERILTDGSVVAVGMGRNVGAVAPDVDSNALLSPASGPLDRRTPRPCPPSRRPLTCPNTTANPPRCCC